MSQAEKAGNRDDEGRGYLFGYLVRDAEPPSGGGHGGD